MRRLCTSCGTATFSTAAEKEAILGRNSASRPRLAEHGEDLMLKSAKRYGLTALWIAFTAPILAADAMSAAASASPSAPVALINNAGIAGDFGTAQSPATIDPDEFQRVLRVNTYAPLRLSRAFMAQVAASRQKKIVSISSGLGSLTRAPDVMQYAPAYDYAISKASLNMAMRMLAAEVKPRGVLAGLVTPGMVDTAMQAQYRAASAAAGTPITAPWWRRPTARAVSWTTSSR